MTAGAEIFIKRQKKEVLQYLTSEEELFDAAKATVATNREKQGGFVGSPMTNLHTIILKKKGDIDIRCRR